MADHRDEPVRIENENPLIGETYEWEIEELRGLFLRMGELAHSQVMRAIDVFIRHDRFAAERVIKDDELVGNLAERIEKLAFQMLALRQPAPEDLRFVLLLYKVASNLERIADYAANVAKRSIMLDHCGSPGIISPVARLGKMTGEVVNDAVTAFQNRDAAKALEARDRDEGVDALCISLVSELFLYILEDQRSITGCTHILFVIRNFECIGDHATEIAEHVQFLINGEMPVGRPHKPEEGSDGEEHRCSRRG